MESPSGPDEGVFGADPECQRAVVLAYRAVSRRERTTAEVRAFLERKEVGADPIEFAIDELVEAGALDDARYARLFAEDRRSIDGWGAERIERELTAKGIASEHVAVAVAEQDRDGELAAAVALLAGKLAVPTTDTERNKAWQMLVRKGYESDLAYDAVRRFASDGVPDSIG